MAFVQIHNITDRPNTPGGPKAYLIGGRRLAPGKHLVADDQVVNGRLRQLHGSRLWFGPLHSRFKRTSKSALRVQRDAVRAKTVQPMTLKEVRGFLDNLALSDLQSLCPQMVPPLTFRSRVSRSALVARLSRALFQPSRELNPEPFFWLRRWKRVSGDYIPLEE